MTESNQVTCISDEGSGRALVLVFQSDCFDSWQQGLDGVVDGSPRNISFSLPAVDENNWKVVGDTLHQELEDRRIRQAVFVGAGAATIPLIYVTLLDQKRTRQLVLIDPASRPKASLFDQVANVFERHMPMGLPLRSKSDGFDAGSFLQRLRCPALIVSCENSPGSQGTLDFFCNRLPSAWGSVCKEKSEIVSRVQEFLALPVRASQKTRA